MGPPIQRWALNTIILILSYWVMTVTIVDHIKLIDNRKSFSCEGF